DLCGSSESEFILTTKRLDGPLLRCSNCRLFFVKLPEKFMTGNGTRGGHRNGESRHVAAEMVRLAEPARELALMENDIEREERPWRELSAAERLDDLKRLVTGKRLLEIGSSTGEMLSAAGRYFEAVGIEPDETLCRVAQSRGLNCLHSTLVD